MLQPRFRTLLVLGRVSNLPTVWSNCLAGWWLSGGGNLWKLPVLMLGASALYIGGMFLNDAFDADFDRERRPGRPIPSGNISLPTVWRLGLVWLALGFLCLGLLGTAAGILAVVLVLCILLYNAVHKMVIASPWLMGLCRFWVYVIAGTTGIDGLNGWPVHCGAALACYTAGLSYFARRESYRGPVAHWPIFLMFAPIILAQLMNTGQALKPALLVSSILALWMGRCAWTLFQPGSINVGRIVSGLLAGIVFVDWLAVAPQCPHGLVAVFLALFGATLVFQHFIPAT